MTLNARCKENAEYLHVLMLNINDIKEKMDGIIDKSSTPADFNSTNKAVSDIFSTFPISNNDGLEIITNAIKEKEDSQNKLVGIYFTLIGITTVYIFIIYIITCIYNSYYLNLLII